jgi:cell division protein FtsB
MGTISLNALSQRWQGARLETRLIAIMVLLLVLAITALFVVRALAIGRLQAEAHTLQIQQAQAIQEITDLQAQLAKENDPATMEYLARSKLGMIKAGEIKYMLIEGQH